MLWAKMHRSRQSRFVSAFLTTVLITAMMGPGLAVFAQGAPVASTSTTGAVEPAPIVSEPAPETPAVDPAVPEAKTPQEPVPTKIERAASITSVEVAKEVAPTKVVSSKEAAPVTAAVTPLAVGPRSDFPDPIVVGEGCDLTTIAILWAGQNYEAGTVSVSNDAENVYVTFATSGGWTIQATHLYVGTTPPASYAPGSFPYQQAHDSVTTYTYTIPLADIGAVAGDTIYIAAHAEVSNDDLNLNETGWAGVGTWPGLMFTHIVQECVVPELAQITVVKFNDLDGNGIMDEGEPVLPGIDFTATMGELVLSDTTDAQGEALFTELADGTYTIDETLPEGWVATTEIPLDVEIVDGQDAIIYVGNMEEDVPPLPAEITVVKFNDLDGNGIMDEGEPVLSGIDFTATMGELVLSDTTDAQGEALFTELADGTYTIDETLPEGWVATTEIPLDVEIVNGQDQTVYVGNMMTVQPDVTKTFRLTYTGALEGVTFWAGYTVGEVETLVELTGDGVFEGQVDFPHGTEITVRWYALYGTELVLLGTGLPETLTADALNLFTYSATASGMKFNDISADGVHDVGEPGISGWTISLYRETEVPGDFALYAVTSTSADGSYTFSGLLPGTYSVAEEDREGWTMTVAPAGAFVITNGSAILGLAFGNTQEAVLPFTPPDLAIAKAAGVATASPGELVTYVLTYRNVSGSNATDFRIVDDYDERYVTIVDAGGGLVVDGTIVWNLAGPLAVSDGPQTLTYTARVSADMPVGTTRVGNVAAISHPLDENLTNNQASDAILIDNPILPFTEEEPFLPFTGSDAVLLGLVMLTLVFAGAAVRFAARNS